MVTMATADLTAVTAWLDDLLKIHQLPDYEGAVNGLQVQNTGRVVRIVASVDASQESIDFAATVPGTLLLVHHGLFWDGNKPVTDRRYRRLKGAIDNDVAVYSAHLPLDAHPEVGNNVLLAKLLGMTLSGPSGSTRSSTSGCTGCSRWIATCSWRS